MKKKIVIPVIIVLILAAIIIVLSSGKNNAEELKYVPVERGDISEKALAVGSLEPEQEIKVKSTISGIVSEDSPYRWSYQLIQN